MYISKLYRLYNRFIFGFCIDVSHHFHELNKNEETNDIVKYNLSQVKELVLTFEFLVFGIDFQIPM